VPAARVAPGSAPAAASRLVVNMPLPGTTQRLH